MVLRHGPDRAAKRRPGVLWLELGYYAVGEMTKLTQDKKLAFTWLGAASPTRPRLKFPSRPKRTAAASPSSIAASAAVRNGRRRKPRSDGLGARPGKSGLGAGQRAGPAADHAAHAGRERRGRSHGGDGRTVAVPVKRGVRIDGTVPGMAAEAAGFQKDDVLVSVDGQKIPPGQAWSRPSARTAPATRCR